MIKNMRLLPMKLNNTNSLGLLYARKNNKDVKKGALPRPKSILGA